MQTLMIILFCFGIIMVAVEFFFMDGLIGLIGAAAIIASWIISFFVFDIRGGILYTGGTMVGTLALVAIELKILLRTRFGRQLYNKEAIEGTSHEPPCTPDLIGREAEAATTLSPSGLVSVDNRQYDAFSVDGYIERGERLKVVDFDSFSVKVKRLSSEKS